MALRMSASMKRSLCRRGPWSWTVNSTPLGRCSALPICGQESRQRLWVSTKPLGQKGAALDWLEKAVQEHEGSIWSINVDPWFITLRNEPRFKALVKRVGPGY